MISIRAMSNVKREHRFLWFIENYNYCWFSNAKLLTSPDFVALDVKGWSVHLYPNGEDAECAGFISIYLYRGEEDFEDIDLKFQLSLVATDGSEYAVEKFSETFESNSMFGTERLIRIDEVLLHKKSAFLPHDTLTVSCKMWIGDENIRDCRIGQTSARTRIGVEKISYLHVVENFTELGTNTNRVTDNVVSPSDENNEITTHLYLSNNSCCEGKIAVEISLHDTKPFLLMNVFFFLVDVHGSVTECGKVDNRFDRTKIRSQKLHLSLTKQLILKKKSEYLPNDKLSLLCECILYAGLEYEKIEEIIPELPLLAFNQSRKYMPNKYLCNVEEKLSACLGALDDLSTIFKSQHLSDVEVKTKTKSFKAHKVILCARSRVFNSTLCNERNTNIVEIDDLEHETVEQLLLFLYSDKPELQWESAIKLYYAAKKYEVEKLKRICSSFLVKNLSTANASELLLLADTHSDSDLKNIVDCFILEHEDEIFGSDKWEKLIDTNPQLVIKTMHLKYKREKESK